MAIERADERRTKKPRKVTFRGKTIERSDFNADAFAKEIIAKRNGTVTVAQRQLWHRAMEAKVARH